MVLLEKRTGTFGICLRFAVSVSAVWVEGVPFRDFFCFSFCEAVEALTIGSAHFCDVLLSFATVDTFWCVLFFQGLSCASRSSVCGAFKDSWLSVEDRRFFWRSIYGGFFFCSFILFLLCFFICLD